MTVISETYGVGGYQAGHPNNNVVERVVDNGDGTCTRTTYDAQGVQTGTTTFPASVVPPAVANERTIRDSFTQALTRSAQIKTQMDAIEAATIGNVAGASVAIKTLAEAVEDLNTAVRRMIRLADNRLDAVD